MRVHSISACVVRLRTLLRIGQLVGLVEFLAGNPIDFVEIRPWRDKHVTLTSELVAAPRRFEEELHADTEHPGQLTRDLDSNHLADRIVEFPRVPGEFMFRRLSVADISHHNVTSSETDRGRRGDMSFHQTFLME